MYAEDLGEDLAGPHEVVDADDIGDNVEGVVVEGQRRVDVEVLDDVLRDLAVLGELLLVHAEGDAAARVVGDVGGEVRDVRRADVEDRRRLPRAERRRVVVRQRRDGGVVDVEAEPRHVVEDRVRALVAPREVPRRVGPLRRPLGRRQHVRHAHGVGREPRHAAEGRRQERREGREREAPAAERGEHAPRAHVSRLRWQWSKRPAPLKSCGEDGPLLRF